MATRRHVARRRRSNRRVPDRGTGATNRAQPRRCHSGRLLPDRMASETRSIGPCHDRVPLRLDHRPLHQPHPRRLRTAIAAHPAPRRPLHVTPGARRSQRRRTRTQDRPRGPRHHPIRAQRRHRLRAAAHQRRDQCTLTAAARSTTPGRIGVESSTTRRVPRDHQAPPPSSDTAPRSFHRDAARRSRRSALADWNDITHRLSINRSRQVVAGRSTEFAPKTRTSRRCIDLDPVTEQHLRTWLTRQQNDGHPAGPDDAIFTNTAGEPLHAESISQLFTRIVARSTLPRIRLHDLRHTHASLLVANGVPIKVVSERLGHAHPGFTMATYQHVLPGMSAKAATDFANLIHPVDDQPDDSDAKHQITDSEEQCIDQKRLPDR